MRKIWAWMMTWAEITYFEFHPEAFALWRIYNSAEYKRVMRELEDNPR